MQTKQTAKISKAANVTKYFVHALKKKTNFRVVWVYLQILQCNKQVFV